MLKEVGRSIISGTVLPFCMEGIKTITKNLSCDCQCPPTFERSPCQKHYRFSHVHHRGAANMVIAITFHKRRGIATRRATLSSSRRCLLRWVNYFAGDSKLIADAHVNIRQYVFIQQTRRHIRDRIVASVLWIYCALNFFVRAVLMLWCLPLIFELVSFPEDV
jgi:hypothetical protein